MLLAIIAQSQTNSTDSVAISVSNQNAFLSIYRVRRCALHYCTEHCATRSSCIKKHISLSCYPAILHHINILQVSCNQGFNICISLYNLQPFPMPSSSSPNGLKKHFIYHHAPNHNCSLSSSCFPLHNNHPSTATTTKRQRQKILPPANSRFKTRSSSTQQIL